MAERTAYNYSFSNFLIGATNKSSGKLLIANFQRNYVWGTGHVKKLLDSIRANEKGHYIGNIVVQEATNGAGGHDRVVDGQQRIVTLALIISELRRHLTDESDLKRCEKILFYSDKNPRVKFSRKNLNDTYKKILRNVLVENPDQSQELLLKNQKAIKVYFEKHKEYKNILEKISALEFVVIKCKTTVSVYQLFEALNSHGKRLSAIELIKNGLFAESNENESVERKINALWEEMEKLFETEEIKNIWFGKFMRHNWFSIAGPVTEGKLYERLKKYLKEENAVEFLENLLNSAKIYTKLRSADLRKKELSNSMDHTAWQRIELLLRNISELEIDQVYAVILALVKYGKKEPEYFEKDRLYRDIFKIWSFIIIVKFSNLSPSKYETTFANFCHDLLNKNSSELKEVKKEFYAKLYSLMPSKNEFVIKLNKSIRCANKEEKKVNFSNSREFVRLLLMIYLTSGEEFIGKYTIEHIIPQGSLVKWKNISEENKLEVERVYRYKLGNLTLLNIDNVENENFNTKYKKSYSKSVFPKNVQLSMYKDLFNSDVPQKAVTKRGVKIATDIYDALAKNLC